MFHRIVKGIQLSFIPAVALLSTGGGLISSSPTLGRTLALVGYVVFAVILCVLVAMKLYFLTLRSTLLPSSRKAGRPISPSQGRVSNMEADLHGWPRRSAIPDRAKPVRYPRVHEEELGDERMESCVWVSGHVCVHGAADGVCGDLYVAVCRLYYTAGSRGEECRAARC